MTKKLFYLKRIFDAYILKKNSQLSFWHGSPLINEKAILNHNDLREYYMPFSQKASYKTLLDEKQIPILDYHGTIGKQYNPIAIAQYGLGHCNIFFSKKNKDSLQIIQNVADWFVQKIEKNSYGIKVWHHYFDFEYARLLKSPWYSGLAQGQIISFLLRAFKITENKLYLHTAKDAILSFKKDITEGGVIYKDKNNFLWIEEYITTPPMHILNGFIWAWWGLYDYCLLIDDPAIIKLKEELLNTLENKLFLYDSGTWSLYDQSDKQIPNYASPFYHKLHIVQLEIMYKLTNIDIFKETADKWQSYADSRYNKTKAFLFKVLFKLKYF